MFGDILSRFSVNKYNYSHWSVVQELEVANTRGIDIYAT